jgi:hypothetical protein
MRSTLAERILTTLAADPGLTDRQLTDRVQGKDKPQQSVNQECRLLERRGLLSRTHRPDGLIGNFPESAASRPVPVTPSAPQPADKGTPATPFLSEDDLKRLLEAWLHAQGWTTEIAWGRAQGADIVAQRGAETWIIEAKGSGSLPAMRANYFLGMLGETLQRMALADARYSIAVPDMPQFRGLWRRLPVLAKSRTGISALFVAPDGAVAHEN